MQRTPIRSVLIVAALLAMLVVSVTVSAQTQPVPAETGVVRWLTYVDPRFDFSIAYPDDWTVTPRNDLPNSFGERLVLTASGNEENPMELPIRIEIGPYLKEKPSRQDLATWSQQYDAVNDVFEHEALWVLNSGNMVGFHSRKVYMKEAISPLTPYTYMNISHGKVVWGFWMNSVSDEYQAILERLVKSFVIGPNAPRTLEQAYGNMLQQGPLSGMQNDQLELPFQGDEISPAQLVGYRVPVNTGANISCGSLNAPVCGGTHTGNASNAIDISVASGTNVYAVSYSILASTQYSNTGYGNLLKMRDLNNGYYAYYAHLSAFLINSSVPTYPGTLIARSGNSGGVSAHLHFHVATQSTGGTGVSLAGMTGLQLYSQYPNCGKATCAEIQALPNMACTCGRVN